MLRFRLPKTQNFKSVITIDNFEGTKYRLADNWFDFIPQTNTPIEYLEIGTFHGANAISVNKSYAKYQDSKIYCVDPWTDYSEYPEYKGKQNIEKSNVPKEKIIIKRGYSNMEIPKFEDNFFDIIYIDGNHQPDYVLEDAVLSFRKLKVGGYMIFDDYGLGGPDLTKRGIDGFITGYHKRIKVLGSANTQVFLQKTK